MLYPEQHQFHLINISFHTGPLTEVNLPIDSFTKKIKGFAHITYMIPEHAVKAFTELDGKIFQVCLHFTTIYELCQEKTYLQGF